MLKGQDQVLKNTKDSKEDNLTNFENNLSKLYNELSTKRGDVLSQNKINKPIMSKIGTKRVCIDNFGLIADSCKRELAHIQKFFMSELSAECNLSIPENPKATNEERNRAAKLIIKGKYTKKDLMKQLQKYYIQFIQCQQCTSSNTTLIKEQRNIFLECAVCKSKYCVTN